MKKLFKLLKSIPPDLYAIGFCFGASIGSAIAVYFGEDTRLLVFSAFAFTAAVAILIDYLIIRKK